MLSPQVLSTVALTLLASLVVSAPTGEEPTKTKEVVKRALYAGTPMGFASGVTGGGSGATVTATTAAQLKSYLESSTAYNIVISGTINFVGTEGTTTYQACDAYPCTPNNGGQALLNTLNACTKATYGVSIDNAGYRGINVKSNKTLVGRNGATLNGKGLRFSGVSNIIIQNVHITNLNPKYVWGGDALSFADSKNIWIDHVRVS
jgi:pectin lyase